jgi:hypothetical protein
MKKLKKGLSLLLVLAMVFSLATTAFAGWDVSKYEDADKITQDEAVAVLSGLGIIEGDETTGTLNPDESYTRAAAAKVLAYMLLGPENAEALPDTSSKFTDVEPGKWYTGVINYLAEQGILSGYGDGTFGPNDNVTQDQWLKMLLCAMGYDEEEAGMGNTVNWAVNARALALKGKLVSADELKLDWNRETAILNAFTAIKLNKNLADSTKTDAIFAVDVVHGENVADKQTGKTDEFGRPTYFYSTTGELADAYATGADEAILTYENEAVSQATLKADLGLTTKTAAAAKFTVYTDGVKAEQVTGVTSLASAVGTYGGTVEVYEDASSKADAPVYTIVVINTYVKVLDTDDVKAATADADAYIVVDTNTNSIPVNGYYTTDAFKKGDVVIYTKTKDSSGYTLKIQSVEKAEYTEGVVSGYTSDYVRVDGEKVQRANCYAGTPTVKDDKQAVYVDSYGNIVAIEAVPDAADSAEEAEATYVYVIDRVSTAGQISTTGVAGATDQVVVTAATAYAKVVDLATGEVKTVAESVKLNDAKNKFVYVGDGNDSSVTANLEVATVLTGDGSVGGEGTVMQYTVSDDGSYVLKKLGDNSDKGGVSVATTDVVIVKGSAVVSGITSTSSPLATSQTELNVITVADGATKDASATVTTETGIANFTAGTYNTSTSGIDAVVYETKDSKITRIFVVKTKTTSDDSSTVAHAIYLKEGESVGATNADKGYQFVVNGEITTYYGASDISSSLSGKAGKPVTLTLNADGKVSNVAYDSLENSGNAKKIETLDTTFVKVADVNSPVYFADKYVVVDGTGETKTYALTTMNEGDSIQYVLKDSKIEFVIVTARKAAE